MDIVTAQEMGRERNKLAKYMNLKVSEDIL